MDMTGLQTFQEIIQEFHKRNVIVYLCEANFRVTQKLTKIGIQDWIGGKRIFTTLSEAIQNVKID